MEWILNKKQIAEVAAIFTELCEKIAEKKYLLILTLGKTTQKAAKLLLLMMYTQYIKAN